ncbi:MAG: flagellar type III secretion system protein FliR [Firmicutes bacterium]|nr:flagellar type III secretion system protein FliR [Bacillota bacterium]
MTILDWTEQVFIRFLLVTMRITGLLTTAPVFQSRNLPVLVRLGLVLFISLVLTPVIPGTVGVASLPAFGLLAIQEILIGLVMGFMVNMALAAIQVAGQLIDVPIGFGMVNVLDPQLGIRMPIIGQLQHTIVLWVFLLVDGHHVLFRALVESYRLLPVGGAPFFLHGTALVIRAFSAMFLLGFTIALPIVGVLFLTSIGLGILVRLIPQVNVFMVGYPLKILIGFIMLWLGMAVFCRWFAGYLSGSGEIWRELLRLISVIGKGP